jgi:preprotein translocase subunit SecG
VTTILITIHVLVCLILIIAVLLQSGKAADLAGAFGGAGSQTAFGPRGAATILSKVTTIGAIVFMLTSMGLWILSAKGTRSVVSGEKETPAAVETKTDAATAPEAGKQAVAPRHSRRRLRNNRPKRKRKSPRTKRPPRILSNRSRENLPRTCRSGGIGRHASLRG